MTDLAQSGAVRASLRGFTLIELMIVVAIVAILAAIAYPSYETHVMKTRRKTAASCLVEAAGYMERFYTTNMRYDQDTSGTAVALPTLGCMTDLSDYYTFSLNPTPTATTFGLRAVPQGVQATKDTQCATLTLDNTGLKGETGTGSATDCWQH